MSIYPLFSNSIMHYCRHHNANIFFAQIWTLFVVMVLIFPASLMWASQRCGCLGCCTAGVGLHFAAQPLLYLLPRGGVEHKLHNCTILFALNDGCIMCTAGNRALCIYGVTCAAFTSQRNFFLSPAVVWQHHGNKTSGCHQDVLEEAVLK